VRDTTIVGVKETIFSVLKVPRQCPLVLLTGARLVFRINSKFSFSLSTIKHLVLHRVK
jgi:hypothetical protein